MKAAVFFTEDQKTYVSNLLKELGAQSIPCLGYKIGRGWENLDGKEWGFHLQQISHVVVLASPRLRKSRWFAFVMGFAIGKNAPVYLLCNNSKGQAKNMMPAYASGILSFAQEQDLVDELLQEHNIDTMMQRIEYSREELTSMGYALTEEAMVKAVQQLNIDAVHHFLQIGFGVDTIDAAGVSILNLAARQQAHQIMQMLLENGADVNQIAEDRKTTALMESAVLGDSKGVGLLLEYTPDPDIQSASGQTALMMAVGEGNMKLAMQLLEYGASIEPVDALGMTAFKYAKLFNHTALIEKMENIHAKDPTE